MCNMAAWDHVAVGDLSKDMTQAVEMQVDV